MREMKLQDLKAQTPAELVSFAEEKGVENASTMRKQELMFAILKQLAIQETDIIGEGVVEVLSDGFGFLRSPDANYLPGPDDIYVSPSQIRRFGLRTGDTIEGHIRSPKEGERYFALLKVNTLNFEDPEKSKHKVNFDNLTPLFPDQRFRLELEDPTRKDLSARVIDIVVCLPNSVDETGTRRFLERGGERAVFLAVGARQRGDPAQVILRLIPVALFDLPQPIILPGLDVGRIGLQRALVPDLRNLVVAELAIGIADQIGDRRHFVVPKRLQLFDRGSVIVPVVDRCVGCAVASGESVLLKAGALALFVLLGARCRRRGIVIAGGVDRRQQGCRDQRDAKGCHGEKPDRKFHHRRSVSRVVDLIPAVWLLEHLENVNIPDL